MSTSSERPKQKTYFFDITDLLCAVRRILGTPLVATAFISYIAMSNLLSGVATFGSTYLQRIFNVLRTTSDLLIGEHFVSVGSYCILFIKENLVIC